MAFPAGWGRKCKLTIDPAKVDANLTDFPVLLTEDNLPEEVFDADGSHPALNGGGDIRFSADSLGATRLACEVVSFVTDNDPANGSAEIWVKIPSVSATVDTDFYIWYDKAGESQPAANDTYGSQNVWDSDFSGVWHLKEPSGSAADSTANGNNGTFNGNMPDAQAGKIGNCQNFAGTDDYISLSSTPSNIPTGNTHYTLQAWIKPDLHDTTSRGIVGWGGWGTSNAVNALKLYQISSTYYANNYWWSNDLQANSGNLADGSWHFIVARFDGTTRQILVDNTSKGTNTPSGHNVTTANNVKIGVTNNLTEDFDGLIDEIRISKISRSTEWLAAEWNNQNDPSTFISADTPENIAPPPVGTVFRSAIFGGN